LHVRLSACMGNQAFRYRCGSRISIGQMSAKRFASRGDLGKWMVKWLDAGVQHYAGCAVDRRGRVS
jgi:hypothetical protein